MPDVMPILNAEIAKLTHLTSGKIGRDWCSGQPFVLYEKGREWDALASALEALRIVRGTIEE